MLWDGREHVLAIHSLAQGMCAAGGPLGTSFPLNITKEVRPTPGPVANGCLHARTAVQSLATLTLWACCSSSSQLWHHLWSARCSCMATRHPRQALTHLQTPLQKESSGAASGVYAMAIVLGNALSKRPILVQQREVRSGGPLSLRSCELPCLACIPSAPQGHPHMASAPGCHKQSQTR